MMYSKNLLDVALATPAVLFLRASFSLVAVCVHCAFIYALVNNLLIFSTFQSFLLSVRSGFLSLNETNNLTEGFMKHYLPHIVGLLILVSYLIADLRAEITDNKASENSVAKSVLKEASSLNLNQGFLEK